ncbi:hypothetical protein V501_01534 [Pseudogymnoascus sp. VKM F-4519 (FW-2642)]|nr:hypothetical protein V501_01534 [Pseudogymnoascus sp. VKM F-4519 (FW-2642)]
MPTLRDIPPEILSSFCECLERPDLRNVRLLNRAFDNAARRILFRTIFLKVNLHSFWKLAKISEHETLRQYVEIFIYDGRELELAEGSGFEEWLHDTAATGMGIITDKKREEFLARFSQQQLHEYYFNFCRYVRFFQGKILQGDNEIKWLLKAMRRFSRLSVVEYAENEQSLEEGRELQPMSFFSPLAQRTLAEPENGWGVSDTHFWVLVCAVFGSQHPQQVTALRGEMLDHENMRKVEHVIPQLNLESIQLLCLEFKSEGVFKIEDDMSKISTRSLATLLTRAPNLTSLRLSYGSHPTICRNRLFDPSLHWKHLTNLSLQSLALSPSHFQQLLQRHSTTLLSLELSNMDLEQRDNEIYEGSAQALWITMIKFLSHSMSLKQIKLIGSFETNTNEAWSTYGDGDISVCRPRQDGCLLSRIEHFIIHGGLCPFMLKMDASYNEEFWNPKHSWTWEEDDTWRFVVLDD